MMGYAIIGIMFLAIAWRVALRPRLIGRDAVQGEDRILTKAAMYTYFALWFGEMAVGLAIIIISPRMAWLAIAVILAGQEFRFWVFKVILPRSPAPHS
jgi:hypothetical protein